MSESFNICLSCGFCCSGLLIGFVQFDKEDLPFVRELMDVEEVDEGGFFFQPCTRLGPQGCTIYSQRPKPCRLFKCKLLLRVENGETSYNSAMEDLKIVSMKKQAIEERLYTLPSQLKSVSFKFQICELRKLLREKAAKMPLSEDEQNLLSEIAEFNTLVTKSFGISLY